MLKIRRWTPLLFAFFIFKPVAASLLEPGDGPYFQLSRERIQYIYDGPTRDVVGQLDAYMQTIRNNYDQSFAWKLDEREDLILASPAQQVANAFATVSPNIKSFWYPSGSGLLEQSAFSSWFLTLATHETSHLYQLNSKGSFNAWAKQIFNNSIAFVPFIWPIFIHPNQFTPTFLIEGNAVLNESRANIGGRLHSGEVRALVLAQLEADEITPTRLINNEFRYPYGSNPYFQGGYFQAHLAAKYGVDKTNQFFVAQGDHWLNPLILNRTFREHFGASYPQEIREYVREYKVLAREQKFIDDDPLVTEPFVGALNHDATGVFFVSSDGLSLAHLHRIRKTDGSLVDMETDLALGKVFFPQGADTPEVATTEQHDLHHQEYSLYAANHAFDPKYRGQIVSDQRAGKTVALDAAHSWLDPHVLVNGEPYDVAHSNPILDEQGNVYYFRQNGSERVMYKNREPVFKYDGFYGKAMEVGAAGEIYFIANTPYGSSLFEYKNHEILRVLKSDRVVDARHLEGDRYVAVEVYPQGNKVYVTEGSPFPAQPAQYAYAFPSYNLIPSKTLAPEEVASEEGTYNALTQLRYSSLDFVSDYNNQAGLRAYGNFTFVDPNQYQTINLGFTASQSRDQEFLGQYTYTKYLPQFLARYGYHKEYWAQYDGAERTGYDQQMFVGVHLPVLRWRHWDASVEVDGIYESIDQHKDPSQPFLTNYDSLPATLATNGIWTQANLSFTENPSPALSFYPWQSFNLNYQSKLESNAGSFTKKVNTSLVQSSYEHGLRHEMYATVSGNVAWAETHDIRVGYYPYPLSADIRIPRLTAAEYFTAKNAASARIEFTKVFNTLLYSPRIPFGIDRIAPFVVAQGLVFDHDNLSYGNYPSSILEVGYGADFQILLAHLASSKIRLLQGFDNRSPNAQQTSVEWQMHFTF